MQPFLKGQVCLLAGLVALTLILGVPNGLAMGPFGEPNGLRLAVGPYMEPSGLRLALGSLMDPSGLRLALRPYMDPGGLGPSGLQLGYWSAWRAKRLACASRSLHGSKLEARHWSAWRAERYTGATGLVAMHTPCSIFLLDLESLTAA